MRDYKNVPETKHPKVSDKKYDSGKAPIWRGLFEYFPRALERVANVSTCGNAKYEWGSWVTVSDGFKRYSDAFGRHQLKEAKGEEFDHENLEFKECHNIRHIEQVAWNALARLELFLIDLESRMVKPEPRPWELAQTKSMPGTLPVREQMDPVPSVNWTGLNETKETMERHYGQASTELQRKSGGCR